jgi:hypothetical protein
MYFVPKYQRGYAWNSDSVADFTKDLTSCFEKRKANTPITHFLGGILCVKHSVTGAVNQHKYEIIDGQQRIATLTLLIACLLSKYNDLKQLTDGLGDTANRDIIKRRIEQLSKRFIEFEQEVHRVITAVNVLELSKPDNPFFTEIIRKITPVVKRDSHKKLQSAYTTLSAKVDVLLNSSVTIEDKIDDLEVIQNVIDNDFTILQMVTTSRPDAFRLFQVLNDRGTNLTDGDLLRAKTLEMLEGFNTEQDAVERLWDDILSDHPDDTEKYLNWVYESHHGSRAPKNALFDMFLEKFFPENLLLNLTLTQAQKIHSTVKTVYDDIVRCRKLTEGQWLYPIQQPIASWDRTRLSIVLSELGHTLAIPMLISAASLDHRKFSEIVQMIERTYFRYKLICKQHETPLKTIYYQESLSIRNDPSGYNPSTLRTKLNTLINSKANDISFKNDLATLEYQEKGGNKPLKYFLMTIEYYYQWYITGAAGTPTCIDKNRVYDFAGTSIEHIYPKNAPPASIDQSLEPIKNSVGNLTIMDPAQNTLGGNDPFAVKKPLYSTSSIDLTKRVGAQGNWSSSEISAHCNFLIDAALAVFRP